MTLDFDTTLFPCCVQIVIQTIDLGDEAEVSCMSRLEGLVDGTSITSAGPGLACFLC